MPAKIVILRKGARYGRWTVIGPPVKRGQSYRHPCRCACGAEAEVRAHHLVSGKSSGCRRCQIDRLHEAQVTHAGTRGFKRTRTYYCWDAMKSRCLNSSHADFHNYGGRGIGVCERWLKYENFLEDMGEMPEGEFQIERSNNDGNYEKDNCRWASRIEQARNRRTNRYVNFQGRKVCVSEAVEMMGHERNGRFYRKIIARLRNGWESAKALATP